MHKCFTTSLLYRKLRLALTFCFLIAIIGTPYASAQNESGVRFLSGFKSDRYDSTRQPYHQRFPIIRTLPPLNGGMPAEVLASYVYLDSLAIFNTDENMVQSTTARAAWLEQPESLRKMIRSYYTATDYDPVTFEQYEMETALKRGRAYKTPLSLMTGYLPDLLAGIASAPQDRAALKSVLKPGYVLRVRVLSIDSTPLNNPTPGTLGTHMFSATAEILDTLKGREIPFYTPYSRASEEMPSPGIPCIRFQYYSGYYGNFSPGRDVVPKEDSVFQRKNAQGFNEFAMRPGQEAIVFLSLDYWRLDTMYDYYQLAMEREAFYALPIIDEQVRDVNRVWSDNLLMSYTDWRRRFVEIREKILSGTF